MRYCFDIDGTICTPTIGRDYHLAEPFYDRIEIINELYEREHYIIYFTARGMGRFAGDPDAGAKASAILFDLTKNQLETWGCKYHELQVATKPVWDLYICDKSIHSDDYFSKVLNG